MGRFIKLAAPSEPAEEDPLAGVANLFDVSVVFIVGLMITLFSVYNLGDLMDSKSQVTLVKTDANGQQEIISKQGQTITAYKLSGKIGSGDGTRLGVAYRLANGQVIYVPETQAAGQTTDQAAAPEAAPQTDPSAGGAPGAAPTDAH